MSAPTPPATQPFECYLGHRIDKDHYHVQRVRFAMPSRGIARQTVQCTTCGKKVRLQAASRRRVLWAVRIAFIVFGLILVLPGVALFFGSSDTPPNIGAGVGVTLAGLVVCAFGFVFANFLVRRETRGRFQVTMPMIRDSGFRQFMAVMVGNWARDLKHRLLVFKQPGANYTTLLPSERSRGARWIGDLVRNRVMSIDE